MNRHGSRSASEALLATHDTADRRLVHLQRNGAIVNDKAFDNGFVKIQGNAEGEFTTLEKAAVAIFKIPTTALQRFLFPESSATRRREKTKVRREIDLPFNRAYFSNI